MHQVHKRDSDIQSLSEPKPKPKDVGKDWVEFCDIVFNRKKQKYQFNHDGGNPGLGVCVNTGYGDGTYDVLVKRDKQGHIMEVRVVFIEEDE